MVGTDPICTIVEAQKVRLVAGHLSIFELKNFLFYLFLDFSKHANINCVQHPIIFFKVQQFVHRPAPGLPARGQ